MTNGDRARKVLGYAREVLREAREMQARCVWSGTVRRGQEVLELCLKAILVEVGVDYPKQHDTGDQPRYRVVAAKFGRLAIARPISR